MTGEVQVRMVEVPSEFVARGRVEKEKEELLKEIREGWEAAHSCSLSEEKSTPSSRNAPLPPQPAQRSELFVLLVWLGWLFFAVFALSFFLVVTGVMQWL